MDIFSNFTGYLDPNSAHRLVTELSPIDLVRALEQSREGSSIIEQLVLYPNSFRHLLQSTETFLPLLDSSKLRKAALLALREIDLFDLPVDKIEIGARLVGLVPADEIGNLSKDLLGERYFILLKEPKVTSEVLRVTKNCNSTILLRFVELAVKAGNRNAEVLEKLDSVLDQGLAMFTGNDLLGRLSSIEVLGELANSPQGAAKLLNPAVVRTVSEYMNDSSCEMYTRNYFVELAGKVYMYSGNDLFLTEQFWKHVLNLLKSSDPANRNKGFSAVHLVAGQVGNPLDTHKEILLAVARFQKSTDHTLKQGFYDTMARVLQTSRSPTVLFSEIEWIEPILNELRTPFEDTLVSILRFLREAVKHQPLGEAVFGVPELAEFLLTRKSYSAEVLHSKFEVVKNSQDLEIDPLVKTKIQEYLQQGVFAPIEAQSAEPLDHAA